MCFAVVVCALTLSLVGHAVTGTVTVVADRDATLIENSDGAPASGAGPVVFAGRNNQADNGVRRALLHFNLAGALPSGGPFIVESVALVVTNVTEANTAPREYRLHRVLADWGEGASSSAGGGGAPSQPGDATWIHTFHDKGFWMHNGGQFEGEPTARLVVAGPGTYRFESPQLARDVALWGTRPELNFGWILIGDETSRQTVRAFGSREIPDPALRPVLEITFRRPLNSGASVSGRGNLAIP
jgi:hypothetical protein